MSVCIISAYGQEFDASTFLDESPLKSRSRLFLRGTKAVDKIDRVRDSSYIIIDIYDSDVNEIENMKYLTAFLKKNYAEMIRLSTFAGVDGVSLKFSLFMMEECVACGVEFSVEILEICAKIGVGIAIDTYLTSQA